MKTLVAIDGSPASHAALGHVLRLVDMGVDAQIVLLNVQTPPSLYEVIVAHDASVIDAVSRSAADHLLAPAEARLDARGLAYEREVGHGDPRTEVLAVAERHGCRAIVLGATGKETPGDGLGSVAEAVLRGARVPVTVVRASTASEPDSPEPVDVP